MATKITRQILEAYLNCKTKAHLKLAGQQGIVSDYEALLVANRQAVRRQAIGKILARNPESRGGEGHLPDRRCPGERAVVRAERHPGGRPAITQLRRPEAGGRAVEAGGFPGTSRCCSTKDRRSARNRGSCWRYTACYYLGCKVKCLPVGSSGMARRCRTTKVPLILLC